MFFRNGNCCNESKDNWGLDQVQMESEMTARYSNMDRYPLPEPSKECESNVSNVGPTPALS